MKKYYLLYSLVGLQFLSFAVATVLLLKFTDNMERDVAPFLMTLGLMLVVSTGMHRVEVSIIRDKNKSVR